jgi:ABC-type sugar transport system ATPase subunit
MNPAESLLLEATHVEKNYGAVRALKDASISLSAGKICGLVGENGAGKSTFMRILAGIEEADGGTITVATDSLNRPVVPAIVPQYPRLAGSIPVWQNLLLGVEPRHGVLIDRNRGRQILLETVRRYAIDLDIDKRAGALNGTELRLAALMAALVRDPRLIILDEPTVGLAETDREAILNTLDSLRRDGLGVLYISHDLGEVCRIADGVTVIGGGTTRKPLHGPVTPEVLAEMMFGGDTGTERPGPVEDHGAAPVQSERGLRFEDTHIYDRLSDRSLGPLSFSAPAGSITALTGIRESGLDLLELYLSGEARVIDGALRVGERRISSHIEPADLRREGAVYIPSDRFDSAAALDGSVEENAILQVRERVHPGGIRTTRHTRGVTRSLLNRFGVSASRTVPLGALSGGTIQKLILARELEHPAPACIIAEPFAGLDLNSQKTLGALLRGIADGGTAVLILSSSVDSVVSIAENIYVLTAGKLTGPFRPEQHHAISHAFAGTWTGPAREKVSP